ncbi:hypothetical protein ACCAA_310097 [Candidatus Accumulibacter aalborgensis]|uniref:HD-GYP domain-containing protein n=1 Tax=Candidatus Accumulibacter aalborgensis TaxID=1860102 RepID=A0A1A8XNZ6_9PROT|nr:hypothetical protein ACCAA_310097 [Candidatus Accumulibacter aalborgensis]
MVAATILIVDDEPTNLSLLTQLVSIRALAQLAETRDPETGNHIQRTQEFVRLLALRLRHPVAVRLMTAADVFDDFIAIAERYSEAG